jgi:hypothetical protein
VRVLVAIFGMEGLVDEERPFLIGFFASVKKALENIELLA